MESNMNAREALITIQAILHVNTKELTDGGLELSNTELTHILSAVAQGLKDNYVQD
jgi:hypothetical protein